MNEHKKYEVQYKELEEGMIVDIYNSKGEIAGEFYIVQGYSNKAESTPPLALDLERYIRILADGPDGDDEYSTVLLFRNSGNKYFVTNPELINKITKKHADFLVSQIEKTKIAVEDIHFVRKKGVEYYYEIEKRSIDTKRV